MFDKKVYKKQGEIIKVDIHGYNGELIDRMKAHSGEKQKGALIIDRLSGIFDVNAKDIEDAKQKDMDEVRTIKQKPFSNSWKKPIIWKRDNRGNIV